MAKINLTSIDSLTNEQSVLTALDNNKTEIETKSDTFFSLDGSTPNTLGTNIDMNSFRIYNLPEPVDDHEPVRLTDLDAFSGGITGDTGPAGAPGAAGSVIYVQNSAPSTTGVPASSIWIDADSTDADLFQISGAAWVDTGTNLRVNPGVGSGDVTGGTASTDGEVVLYNGTGGKTIKRSNGISGIAKLASGVLSAAVSSTDYAPATSGSGILKGNGSGGFSTASAGTDYYNPGGTDVAVADGGTGSSTAAGARTNLGLGTSAVVDTGTSGTKVALTDGANSWSASQTFINASGVKILDTNASHTVGIVGGSDITANRTITATTGDASVTLDFTNNTASAGTSIYAGIPITSKSAAYTTVLADANTCIWHPTADNNARTFTIDSNANVAYPVGTTLTFINEINTVTISITSDTMVLASAGTTGSRTLAANGVATAVKVSATRWYISGNGLT